MNLRSLFQDFNPSKFILFFCLLIFTALFALRLDETISWSYWVVFLPLWIWKFITVLGATIGTYVWWKQSHSSLDDDNYIQYKAMLICLALHFMLLMFEFLSCDKLESGRHLWILVFIPLILISIVSIGISIWAVKHDRSFEFELFCAVNVLQFILLALRLDKFIMWTWEIVFIPFWVVMCLSLVAVLYSIIFASIIMRASEVTFQHRRTSANSAVGHTLLVVPILVFQVLLTNKLDGDTSLSYLAVTSPLFITFITLIISSFGSKGGNYWWFGIRKDFCQFLLGICPLLQEYGNISFNMNDNQVSTHSPIKQAHTNNKKFDLKPVLPHHPIDVPD